MDNPGRLERRGGVDDGPDDPVGVDVARNCTIGIRRLDRRSRVGAAMLVEIPPRNPVLHRDDRRFVLAERRDVGSDSADLVRLDGEDHDVLRTSVSSLVECGSAADHLRAVLADDSHPGASNGVEVRATRDERDVLTGGGQPPADVAANRTRTDDGDLHGRARSGRSTKIASSAATKFMIAATTKTPRHPAADAPIRLLNGTTSDATPLATYSKPALADAKRRP